MLKVFMVLILFSVSCGVHEKNQKHQQNHELDDQKSVHSSHVAEHQFQSLTQQIEENAAVKSFDKSQNNTVELKNKVDSLALNFNWDNETVQYLANQAVQNPELLSSFISLASTFAQASPLPQDPNGPYQNYEKPKWLEWLENSRFSFILDWTRELGKKFFPFL